MTEASGTEPKAGVWVPGMKSPNPAGRPPGPSKQQKLLRRMLDEANDVLDAVLAKAKEGDPASAGLIFGRILPVLRAQSQTVTFDFDPSLPVARQVGFVPTGTMPAQTPHENAEDRQFVIRTLWAIVRNSNEAKPRADALDLLKQLGAKT